LKLDSETRLSVRVRPGAGRSRIKDRRGGILRLDVAAPPERGKANQELVKFLAKILRLPKSRVRICSGERSRDKVVGIAGVEEEEVARVVDEVLGGKK
jgi:uncharacterized protein (TIGR00251 family)